jgi:hypothetical protein
MEIIIKGLLASIAKYPKMDKEVTNVRVLESSVL